LSGDKKKAETFGTAIEKAIQEIEISAQTQIIEKKKNKFRL